MKQTNKKQKGVCLVLYPNTSGIAYLICENAQEVLDYGIKNLRPFSQYKFIRRVQWLFDFAEPKLIVLLNDQESKVSKRIKKVIQDIEYLAEEKNLDVKKYSRTQIKDTFSVFHAKTKYEIATQIMKWFKELDIIKPHKRLPWSAEHYQMGVFDAFALMLTHYYLQD